MHRLGLLLALAACTEHGKGGGDAFSVHENKFAEALCQNACVPVDQQDDCIVSVLASMDQARLDVGPSGEAACVACMQKKIDLMPQVVANGCASTAELDGQVAAACDIDPMTDFDGDGNPTNDFSEACAGHP